MSIPFMSSFKGLARRMAREGEQVDTNHWQALTDRPQVKTLELMNVGIAYDIAPTPSLLEKDIEPNLPWAEDQFQERVAGEPVNPGVTYMDWPYYKGNVEEHKQPGEFSHTYMERFWPKHAGTQSVHDDYGGQTHGPGDPDHWLEGIRYRYGDYDDLLQLLLRYPYTRQAYLPIFFPEDTGAHHGERIPCTLGYHLMRRGDKLHCFYPMRSCDLLRHFQDDVYMACRLVQHTIDKLRWFEVEPGTLSMHMTSLHVFDHPSEIKALERIYLESQ